MIKPLCERTFARLFAAPSSGPLGYRAHGRSVGTGARPALRPVTGLYSAKAAAAA
jgi:hypothetical protein